MSKGWRRTTLDDVRFIYENWTKMSTKEIAAHLGFSPIRVSKIKRELRRRLEAAGLPVPKNYRSASELYDEFVTELKQKQA